jgi:hypothetical protein
VAYKGCIGAMIAVDKLGIVWESPALSEFQTLMISLSDRP